MRLFKRKSQLQRLLKTDRIKFGVPGGGGSGKALKAALPNEKALKAAVPNEKALKAGLIAGGLAGLTAGSAGISSLRRRKEGARDDS
jgi:hypothetical protein